MFLVCSWGELSLCRHVPSASPPSGPSLHYGATCSLYPAPINLHHQQQPNLCGDSPGPIQNEWILSHQSTAATYLQDRHVHFMPLHDFLSPRSSHFRRGNRKNGTDAFALFSDIVLMRNSEPQKNSTSLFKVLVEMCHAGFWPSPCGR